MAERIFRILSLSFLTVGFVVGVASADKDGDNDVFNGAQSLIKDVNDAEEANAINNGQYQPTFIVNNETTSNEPKTLAKARIQSDYIPLPAKKDLSDSQN